MNLGIKVQNTREKNIQITTSRIIVPSEDLTETLSLSKTFFGFAPYLFSPGLLSVNFYTISQIPPTKGISDINSIHPLFPTSCSLRTATANPGIKMARE